MEKLTRKQIYSPYWFYLSLLIIYIVGSFAHAAASNQYQFNGILFIVLIFLSVVFRGIADNQKNLQERIDELENKLGIKKN